MEAHPSRRVRSPAPAALAVLAAAAAVALPAPVLACTCIAEGLPSQLERATDVFVATVESGPEPIGGARTPVPEGIVGGEMPTRQVQYTLAVKQVFKGGATSTTRVATPSSAAACGMTFQRGETYLVLARVARSVEREAGATPSPDLLQTDLCMGNVSGDRLEAAIAEAQRLAGPAGRPSEGDTGR